jgi:hypothetical protein
MQNINVSLKAGVDDILMQIAARYYYPFIGTGKKVPLSYSFTIMSNKNIAGFIEYIRNNDSLCICVFPKYSGKGIGKKSIELLFNLINVNKIKYIVKSFNYPSLKLLYNCGGGISEKINDELCSGYILKNENANNVDKILLENTIEESKNKYIQYYEKIKNRKNILRIMDNVIESIEFIKNEPLEIS